MPDETRAIEPALTVEEWKAIADESMIDPGRLIIALRDNPEKVMARANAMLPDDDPRKIRQADVRNVKDAIGTIMMGVRVESLSIQGLWDLAAKLTALLPPEG